MQDIAAEALTKDFGRIRAVDDVSFEVRPRRVVGLLGPNGSGKTTTLRMLLDLVTPPRAPDVGHLWPTLGVLLAGIPILLVTAGGAGAPLVAALWTLLATAVLVRLVGRDVES